MSKVTKSTSTALKAPASYQFECELHADYLNNLSVNVGTVDKSSIADITDDLKLESYFLQQALAAVAVGRSRLESCGRVFVRPATYHAHMLKTVSHLQRVQKVRDEENKKRDASAEARKQRLLKASAKKVQNDKLQERQKERTDDRKKLEGIKKQTGSAADSDFQVETAVEDIIRGGKNNKATKSTGPVKSFTKKAKPSARDANPKKDFKNKKFGFGGKESKMQKRNTKESVNDMTGFKAANTKSPFFNRSNGKVNKSKSSSAAGGNRPGKARRQQMRSKKNSRN